MGNNFNQLNRNNTFGFAINRVGDPTERPADPTPADGGERPADPPPPDPNIGERPVQ